MTKTTTDQSKLPSCYACDSSLIRVAYDDSIYRVLRCMGCGLHFVNPLPLNDDNETHNSDILYDDGSDIIQMEKQKVRAEITADEIAKLYKKGDLHGKRLLDIGCGYGLFLKELKNNGWTVYGCEQNKNAIKYADRMGVEIHEDLKDKYVWREHYYDVITLWNVLEHINDPYIFLCDLHKILQAEGAIIIRVPNIILENAFWKLAKMKGKNPPYMDLPMHLFGFTVSSLKLLLDKAGYHDINLIFSPLGDKSYSLKKRYGPIMGQLMVRFMEYINLLIFKMPLLKSPGLSSITILAYASKK